MKLQGVIFDLDGVITDTAHLHFQAWQQIAAEIGISIDAQFNESLKGISRDESLRRILQHGGKEGDFNSQERAQLAYRKNLLYVHSLRELTVSAVLPGSFSPSARMLPNLKTRNRTRKSFSPPVPGWACRRRHVSALKMRRRALTPLTPAVCARWGSARA